MTPEQLFEKNQRLAYWVLRERYKALVNDDDMRQEALYGLWQACNGYKPELGHRFSTYAARCILHRIELALERKNRKQMPADSLDRQAYRNGDAKIGDLIPCGIGWEDDVIAAVDFDNALAALTPKQREIICGMAAGATQTDIAKREGIGPQAINERCRLARKKLAALMG